MISGCWFCQTHPAGPSPTGSAVQAWVGEGPEVKVVSLQADDRFLLCTDGLSGVVSDDQLLSFIKDKTDMQECADGLCNFALEAGSRDNISCVMIEVVETA